MGLGLRPKAPNTLVCRFRGVTTSPKHLAVYGRWILYKWYVTVFQNLHIFAIYSHDYGKSWPFAFGKVVLMLKPCWWFLVFLSEAIKKWSIPYCQVDNRRLRNLLEEHPFQAFGHRHLWLRQARSWGSCCLGWDSWAMVFVLGGGFKYFLYFQFQVALHYIRRVHIYVTMAFK